MDTPPSDRPGCIGSWDRPPPPGTRRATGPRTTAIAASTATRTAPRSGAKARARRKPKGALGGRRIEALDTFRGVAVAAVLVGLAVGDVTALPDLFHPAPWQGFRLADLVAPFLLVASGTALACTRARNQAGKAAGRRLLRRTVVLVAVAAVLIVLDTGSLGPPTLEVVLDGLDPSAPLPRLAIAWLAVWWIAGFPRWGQALAAASLLLVQWFALSRLDATSADGLITIPTIAVTVLAGYWFGEWLRSRPDGPATAVATALSGLYIGAAGILVAQVLPLNRTLWTPTFVIFTAGAALLAFALVYTLVTVLRVGRPLLSRITVLGRHALVAYVAVAATTTVLGVGERGSPWERLLDGFGATFGPELGALLLGGGVVTLAILLVGAVDRRGWYLRA